MRQTEISIFFHNFEIDYELRKLHVLHMKTQFRILIISILATASVLMSSGCASAPGTEVTDEQINAEAEKAYAEIKAKSKLSSNAEWNAMVQRVSKRIAAASGENFKWEVMLIEDKQANAWCMPGGKMAVYTGILPVVKTEAALAAVMGHEVAHATQRHGKESYTRAVKDQYMGVLAGLGTAVAGQYLCNSDDCKKMVAMGGMAVGFGITYFSLKYSRGDETEADKVGLRYMAQAGYEPTEAVKLWERMEAAGGGKGPEFLSTHPSGQTRIGELNRQMSEAQVIYQNAPQKYGLGSGI